MAAIFLFSSIPGTELPNYGFWDILVKKGGHLIGYALLGAAWSYGLEMEGRRGILRAWALASLFALSDEFHQSFVPGRYPSLADVGIDSFGALLGAFAYVTTGGALRALLSGDHSCPK